MTCIILSFRNSFDHKYQIRKYWLNTRFSFSYREAKKFLAFWALIQKFSSARFLDW